MSNIITLVSSIEQALMDLKAQNIVTLDMRNISNCICSFFVICHGTSNTHVSALADAVEEKVEEQLNDSPLHTEGQRASEWIVVDYGDVIVHIFQEEKRNFYQLEDLWADGVKKEIKEFNTAV